MAYFVKPNLYPVPVFTQEEIINNIISGESLSATYDKSIPIVGVGREGVKFERTYVFRSEENKKEKTVKNTEFKVTVIIPRTHRFLRHKEDFIRSVNIKDVKEFVTVTYMSTSYGCL